MYFPIESLIYGILCLSQGWDIQGDRVKFHPEHEKEKILAPQAPGGNLQGVWRRRRPTRSKKSKVRRRRRQSGSIKIKQLAPQAPAKMESEYKIVFKTLLALNN